MLEKSEMYCVTVDDCEIEVNNIQVSAYPINQVYKGYQRPTEQTEIAGLVSFDIDKKVYVKVKTNKKIEKAEIRPRSLNIQPDIIDDNTIGFYIDKPTMCSVEVNDYHSCLHLFANAVSAQPEDCIYFAKGVYDIGVLKLESNQHIYLEDGAVIYGRIEATDVENVSIEGRGIICGSKNEERTTFTRFLRCRNVRIEGVILCDACEWCTMFVLCDDVVVENVKLVGMWRYNADGFDIVNSSNIKIKNCYIRTFDDCIAIKGADGFNDKSVQNVEISGCIVWCDWGRAFEIGAETCAQKIEGIKFRDCTVVRTQDVALDIQHTDYADIKDILFENIAVEQNERIWRPKLQEFDDEMYVKNEADHYSPHLIVLEIKKNMWTSSKDFGTIKGVRFTNITAPSDMPIRFTGANSEHCVSGVVMEKFTFIDNGCPTYEMRFVNDIHIL